MTTTLEKDGEGHDNSLEVTAADDENYLSTYEPVILRMTATTVESERKIRWLPDCVRDKSRRLR